MDSFKKWLEDADQERRLDKQAKVIEKPARDTETKLSPWHQQRKMKKR